MESGDRVWRLAGAACGILGPVLLQLGFGLRVAGWGGGFINPGTPTNEIARVFARRAPAVALAGDELEALGVLCFIIFAARLWATLRQAEGQGAWISAISLASAVLFSAAGLGALAADRAIDLRAGYGLDASAAARLAGEVPLTGALAQSVNFLFIFWLLATSVTLLVRREMTPSPGHVAVAVTR